MNHADPWDEIVRLEKQMDAELLAGLEDAPEDAPKRRAAADHARSGNRNTGSDAPIIELG